MARHVKNHKRKIHGNSFWDQEYTKATHLALSTEPSEDLEKFTRWLIRQNGKTLLNLHSSVIDLGCGNGRNLIYLAKTFGNKGIGYDSSAAAIKQAKLNSEGLNLDYLARSISGALNVEENTQSLALDMMSSHFLNKEDRTFLRDEIYRILKPGGFLFFKTFLRDGDLHTKRLIEDNPADEEGAYIHPVIGVAEYTYGEEELIDFLSEKFLIHKTYSSHQHRSKGKARKRRTISVYAEKDPFG
ncbi:class I SAM-dependent methyltransferase [Candidatus Kaiserbacteria bacterium]|nr:class I SAM-dependent methyltransferase [Candidatus Kaiserbacteria bacterium]